MGASQNHQPDKGRGESFADLSGPERTNRNIESIKLETTDDSLSVVMATPEFIVSGADFLEWAGDISSALRVEIEKLVEGDVLKERFPSIDFEDLSIDLRLVMTETLENAIFYGLGGLGSMEKLMIHAEFGESETPITDKLQRNLAEGRDRGSAIHFRLELSPEHIEMSICDGGRFRITLPDPKRNGEPREHDFNEFWSIVKADIAAGKTQKHYGDSAGDEKRGLGTVGLGRVFDEAVGIETENGTELRFRKKITAE